MIIIYILVYLLLSIYIFKFSTLFIKTILKTFKHYSKLANVTFEYMANQMNIKLIILKFGENKNNHNNG